MNLAVLLQTSLQLLCTTRIISPGRPALAKATIWPQPRDFVAESPSLDLEHLHSIKEVPRKGWNCQGGAVSPEDDEDEDLFALTDDESWQCAELLSDDDCSCPPSPLFEHGKRRAIFSSPSTYSDLSDDDASVVLVETGSIARVLFADDEISFESKIAIDLPTTIIQLPCAAQTYAELYPGEEDDEAYFAELPIFSDVASLGPQLSTTATSPATDDSISSVCSSVEAVNYSTIIDWLDLTDSRLPSPKLPLHYLFKRSNSCDSLLYMVEEDQEVVSLEDEDCSSADGDYDDAPSFLSAPSPSSALSDSPVESEGENEHCLSSEAFVDLSLLRRPLTRRPWQGPTDWRDGLRRSVMLQSACKVAQTVAS